MESLSGIAGSSYRAVMQPGVTGDPLSKRPEPGSTQSAGDTGIRLPEDRVTLSGRQPSTEQAGKPGSPAEQAGKQPKPGEKTTPDGKSLEDPQIQAQIARLKQIEEKVKAHEAAHKAVGGNLASSASYSYTQGPDGRSYITGGEVQIDMSDGKTPQETISRMQQVIRAALAPADPSGQDRAVASAAASRMAEAQQEKLQAESPTAEPDPTQPVDPAQEAIRQSLNPEKGTEGAEPPSGNAAADSNAARIRNAYGNPAVQGSEPGNDSIPSQRQAGPFANPELSLISAFA
ncbi:MAG: hypothetical protein FIA89_15735 [Geobacter sp.]|jgi:hypothetical protein|nr:hypothetical protein [Geobacter sp.]